MADDYRIDALCRAYGVALSYADAEGRTQHASAEGKRHALQALGIDVSGDAAIDAGLVSAETSHRRVIPELIVTDANASRRIALNGAGNAEWTLATETGEILSGREDHALVLPPLAAGYHRITLKTRDAEVASTILSAPSRCYLPEALASGQRGWGVTAQVYSLRGTRDIGIGTYAEVAKLAGEVGDRGGAFLGLSPVHALFGADSSKYSPYSPSSRLFLQTGLIAPHLVEGFEPGDVAPASSKPLIDYHSVLPAQRAALEKIWARTKDGAVRASETFRRDGGTRLEEHATFEALSDHFMAQGLNWPGVWPDAFRAPRSAEGKVFRADHDEAIAFHVWLQWLADTQLAAAAGVARKKNMTVGLYRDLAVGADRGGSEYWSAPESFVATLSVGAPPDPLGPQGQDWGLPPLHPVTLASSGLAAYRALVSANMRHAGAIRIDHAFQLQRLFVIPAGGIARDGVYLDYPLHALLAVLKIESHRAKCLVIGEDLGTAPAGFSNAIMEAGMLSYRVLPFERRDGGVFKEPAAYPAPALAALSTHDLPTFAGWWRGLDVDVRECLGVFDAAQSANDRVGRAIDRARLAEALHAEGLDASRDIGDPPDIASMRYLARTPCVLAAVQIEDVLREEQQANLPGPDCGHPNWRRRSSVSLDGIERHPGLDRVAAAFAAEGRSRDFSARNIPRATYRLQLHAGFTFDDAAATVPYLAALGVSHVYVSPIQMAAPGSTHGYDVVDPTRLNPELGSDDAFARFSDALQRHGLRLLVDIVPNHVGVGGKSNPWWLDVLEWGRRSRHADFFDIDWERDGADGKLIVPFLGEPFEALLAKRYVGLGFEAGLGRFAVWYGDHCHPVSPLHYAALFSRARGASGEAASVLEHFENRFAALRDAMTDEMLLDSARTLRRELSAACDAHPSLRQALERVGGEMDADGLRDLCARQAWRLVAWTEANQHINYRRFFDITSLAGIRVEDEKVFEASHLLIFGLVEEGRIHGLRCDHVDGLADPAQYLQRLQARVGPGFPVVVEKILEPGEALPAWPIAGTTGYDVLHSLDAIFFAPDALPVLDDIAQKVSPATQSRDDALFDIKADLATGAFKSEFLALVADIAPLLHTSALEHLEPALQALLAACPVYRTYGDARGFSDADRAVLANATKIASERLDATAHTTLGLIVSALGRSDASRARRRFQQLTGPLMAKSFEDTLFYRDVRFIAANEVGCGPAHPGMDVAPFHNANVERQRDWPDSFVATSTHDTKRGEDARGRLLAASHDPTGWALAWQKFQTTPSYDEIVDADAYFLFQTMAAACPLSPDETERRDFVERTHGFVEKLLREGKQRSSWIEPHEGYENAVKQLAADCARADGVLFTTLAPFIRDIAEAGAKLGVARTVLKCTVPGIPDIYQGTELIDLAYVDPDNRRPVNYATREALIGRAIDSVEPEFFLSGEAKFRALASILQDRREHPATYRDIYTPLAVSDASATLAFIRGKYEGDLCVVARRVFSPSGTATPEAQIVLPIGQWRNLLNGQTLEGGQALDVGRLLGSWPATALRRIG